MMPNKTGLDFLKDIRETDTDTPFILFTGRGKEDVAVEALNMGADGYFDKFGAPSAVYEQLLCAITSSVKARRVEDDLYKFKALSDRVTYGVMLVNFDGEILYVNEAFAKMHGYTPDEVMGENHLIFYPPDSLVQYLESKLLFEKGYLMMEETRRRKDGSLIPVLTNVTIINDLKGKPSFLAVTIADVTKRKEVEEKLKQSEAWHRAVFENTGTATCILNEDKTFFLVNREFEALSECSQEELKGKKWTEFVTIDYLKRMEKYHETRRKNGKVAPKRYTFDFVTKTGQIRNVLLIIDMIPGTKKSVASIIDLTEHKKTENKLKNAVEDLSLVNEKLNVVGTLTRHDVRNKLAVIMGNLSIAKELLPPNHRVLAYLNRTESSFEEISRIFDRAYAYEHMGVDTLSYVDVKKSCDEVVSLFHDFEGIQLVKNCEGLTVYADSLLGQLFYNLIDNSLKHGEHVNKIVMHYEKSKDCLKLIYEDNGVGIAASRKAQIFSECTDKRGGIGLHMIKHLCDIYGWSIQETGVEGQGAKFVISVPNRTKNGKKGYILSQKLKETKAVKPR